MSALSNYEQQRCTECGQPNPVWFAPNEVWNRVIGGPEATDDPGGFLCPLCFIRRAEAAGIVPAAWVLSPESAADEPEGCKPSQLLTRPHDCPHVVCSCAMGAMPLCPTPPTKGEPEPATKSAAQLLREIAAADREAHNRALARGYGAGEPEPCGCRIHADHAECATACADFGVWCDGGSREPFAGPTGNPDDQQTRKVPQ